MPIDSLRDFAPISAHDQTVILLGTIGLAFIVVDVLRDAWQAVTVDLHAIHLSFQRFRRRLAT